MCVCVCTRVPPPTPSPLLQNMTVIEAEKDRVIPALPRSVHREELITRRLAFLGGQHGLGVFHCAHS